MTTPFKDLTIIVPTFNRPSCLRRAVEFYHSISQDITLVVADSSVYTPQFGKELTSLGPFKYKRFAHTASFQEKINESLISVTTDFCTIAADDDFVLPSALSDGMAFLRSNPDYTTYHGTYLHYYAIKLPFLEKKIIFSTISNRGSTLYQNSPLERVLSYVNGVNTYYPFYALHRSEDLKFVWSHTEKYVDDWGLLEHVPSATSLALGKMYVSERPFSIREPNFYTWITKSRFLEMYSDANIRRASEGISIALKDFACNEEETKAELIASFKKYRDSCVHKYPADPGNSLRSAKVSSNRVRKLLRDFRHLSGTKVSKVPAARLVETPLGCNLDELKKLKQVINGSERGNEIIESRVTYGNSPYSK